MDGTEQYGDSESTQADFRYFMT